MALIHSTPLTELRRHSAYHTVTMSFSALASHSSSTDRIKLTNTSCVSSKILSLHVTRHFIAVTTRVLFKPWLHARTVFTRVSVCVRVNAITRETMAALFYSPVDFTDASDMHQSDACLMHVWCIGEINRWIKQRSQCNNFWNVWDIIMKFLWEHDMVKKKRR